MNQTRQAASKAPTIFSLAVALAYIVMVLISTALANRWAAQSQSWYLAATVGRVASSLILLALLAQLGWLEAAGFLRRGSGQMWLLTLLLLAYAAAVSTYAMTGLLALPFLTSRCRQPRRASFLALAASPAAATDPRAWLVQTLLIAPLAVVGLALLWRSGQPAAVSAGAQRMAT